MRELPIPVERYDAGMALTLGCPGCGFSRQATGDECASYPEPEYHLSCPRCDKGLMWKYAEADKCPACGRLGWWDTPYEHNACSRVCSLQLEYLTRLASTEAA